MKKAKLLSVVEAQFESSSSSANQPQQNNAESKESSSESSSSSSSSSEEESTSLSAIIEQFNGQECSVPFGTSDQYHDAILKAENEGENLRTPESLLFNAFFLYPLTQSMLTCPFYLKGSCRFTSSTNKKPCKYSHGHRVTVQQIRPKSVYSIGEEVNYQKDGDNCNRKLFGLVRNSALPATSSSGESSKNDHHHHLWTRCEIVKTDPGTGRVLVKLVRDCTDFWVPMEMLVLVDQEFEKEEEEIEVPAMMSSQMGKNIPPRFFYPEPNIHLFQNPQIPIPLHHPHLANGSATLAASAPNCSSRWATLAAPAWAAAPRASSTPLNRTSFRPVTPWTPASPSKPSQSERSSTLRR